jgi:hypothetical protein
MGYLICQVPEEKLHMNKFAKSLILSLILVAPVAIFSPAVQAAKATTTLAATTVSNTKSVGGKTKVGKHKRRHHHRRGVRKSHKPVNTKSISKEPTTTPKN